MRNILSYKAFENNDDYQELADKLKELNSLIRHTFRNQMPYELLEDVFLHLIEGHDGFIPIAHKSSLGGSYQFYKSISFNALRDKSTAEEDFYKIIKEINNCKKKLEEMYGFNCHYRITCNGVHQSEWNPETYRNDLYLWKDPDLSKPYSGTFYDGYKSVEVPDNKVVFKVDFFII